MSLILQVDELTRSFGKVNAVNGISFNVKQGTCFGLLGPNGAGKTTTIEMLEGIVKPSSGKILYQGKPLTESIYQELGIQFQHTAIQDYLTVKETLEMFGAFYHHTIALDELIELCQLEDFLQQDHRKLSGGQKQRLLLALALINDPKLIFLDEPTTGLDPHSRRLFWQLVNKIKANGKTIILTTHYMDEAEYLCDEIAIMDKGKIIALDTPDNLLKQHFKGALIKLNGSAFNHDAVMPFEYQVVADKILIQSADIQATLLQLINQEIALDGLQVKSATLDDLFLKLTGHGLNMKEEPAHV
ncbi:ABC transporter ATP-binding protein [Pseudoalteromonas tunicata]|jgi:ABC-2 type transport system ATP-binding protein|uniref:ABC transporter, ATP-binding protein n=1 Tax=Pseudoalteromonas tunicata D2 TaxID=87626 RepID=A4C942_9GAMM|nr:ABC transporter ATP-binding protein [Pseudoalteromonas tunicata]ATC93609.1 ABC-2 type transport system ATP-binding protein [Pseudoalteromonas tunicata]AXT29445.1 ABC transporter ATP-binding protein [Pseudoalteromonas tunicata]EAR29107.1 ABC transporter, ATP-binding protein [Pseudoalteromonas tunicata D2]MDP4983176.1 ABC transporter ATP-binding protein [Pseudoalteromonas tunicata]